MSSFQTFLATHKPESARLWDGFAAMTSATSQITSRFNKHTASLRRSTGTGGNQFTQTLDRLVPLLRSDIDSYAGALEEHAPRSQQAARRIRGNWIQHRDIWDGITGDDESELRDLRNSIGNLRQAAEKGLDATRGFGKSLATLASTVSQVSASIHRAKDAQSLAIAACNDICEFVDEATATLDATLQKLERESD